MNGAFFCNIGLFLNQFQLPDTLWQEFSGKALFLHTLDRLKASEKINRILPFAEDRAENSASIKAACSAGLEIILPPIRPLGAQAWLWIAEQAKVEALVQITPFSPLLNAQNIDAAWDYFLAQKCDLLVTRGYYPGYTCNWIFSKNALKALAEAEAKSGNTIEFLSAFLKNPTLIKELKVEYWLPKEIYPQVDLSIKSASRLKKLNELWSKFEDSTETEQKVFAIRQELTRKPYLLQTTPAILELELTNDCNLHCIMCPRQKLTRPVGYMSPELFGKILKECHRKNISLSFSLAGEPTLHPEFLNFVQLASKLESFVPISINSNGTLLDENLSASLLDCKAFHTIIFGINAFQTDTYTKITGKPLLEEVVKNVKDFLKLKKEKIDPHQKYKAPVNPIAAVQIIKMKQNNNEIEDYWKFWSFADSIRAKLDWNKKNRQIAETLAKLEEEIDQIKHKFNYREGNSKPIELIQAQEDFANHSIKLRTPLTELFFETFYQEAEFPLEYVVIQRFDNFLGKVEDFSVMDFSPLERIYCRSLQQGFSVLWDGQVIACREDFNAENVLGDLKNQSIEEIFCQDKFSLLQKAHEKLEFSAFRNCEKCKEWYYIV